MEDKTLTCEDCGKEFVFTAVEHEFYAERGLLNTPKRCPECRKARRHKSRRRLYDAKCSACGADTKVPFKPTEGKEVYCRECFAKMKETQASEQAEQ